MQCHAWSMPVRVGAEAYRTEENRRRSEEKSMADAAGLSSLRNVGRTRKRVGTESRLISRSSGPGLSPDRSTALGPAAHGYLALARRSPRTTPPECRERAARGALPAVLILNHDWSGSCERWGKEGHERDHTSPGVGHPCVWPRTPAPPIADPTATAVLQARSNQARQGSIPTACANCSATDSVSGSSLPISRMLAEIVTRVGARLVSTTNSAWCAVTYARLGEVRSPRCAIARGCSPRAGASAA